MIRDPLFYEVLFALILSSYLISMFTGYLLGKRKVLSVQQFTKRREYLIDPLTKRAKRWMDGHLMQTISDGKWVRVCLLIFLNNLILGAFVPRTLYGIIFVLPYFLTVWEGMGQGVVFSKTYSKNKPLNFVFFFEFGGYLLATLAGINVGLSLLLPSHVGIAEAFIMAWKDVVYIYPVVVTFLLLGAVSETLLLKGLKLPIGAKFDADKAIKQGLKMFEDKK